MTRSRPTASTSRAAHVLRSRSARGIGLAVLLLLLAAGTLIFASAWGEAESSTAHGTTSEAVTIWAGEAEEGGGDTADGSAGATNTHSGGALDADAAGDGAPLDADAAGDEDSPTPPEHGAEAAAEGSSPGRRDVHTEDVDVVIYGTTTSGVGTLRGLQIAGVTYPERLRVAVVTRGPHLESPLAQGLGVEDVYGPDSVSGFYAEFRRGVIGEYASRGLNPLTPEGRLVYEPETAEKILRFVLDRNGSGRPNVLFVMGGLVEAEDQDERYLLVDCGNRLVRLNTRFFVDASPEADLARMLGASYSIGRTENVYNDVTGNRAPRPSSATGWVTAPQALSILLTLKEYRGPAPRVVSLRHPGYDAGTYDPDYVMSERVRSGFAGSWSLSYRLPNNKFELNEAWGDYTNAHASYDWTMYPEKRAAIRATIQTYVLNKFRYLQENGYGHLGVVHIPSRPYVREGVRILGKTTYTEELMLAGSSTHPIAYGRYARYDRHDAVVGPEQDGTAQSVHVPMEALMPEGHPWLLVTTAVSTDYRTYSSAVRMEPVRANMGGAAGIILAVASARGTAPHNVSYEEVRRELLRQGYRLR